MGKNPAFQWYPGDWLRDTELQQASPSSRGIWINLLSHMWFAQDRGVISGPLDELRRLAGCNEAEWLIFYEQNCRLKFADVTFSDGIVTVKNRRMVREERIRKLATSRQSRHRSRDCHANVTPPSPSTSNTASPTPKRKKKEHTPTAPPAECTLLLNFWSDLYLERNGQRPEIEGKRDMICSKAILSGRTLEQAQDIVRFHFDHPSEFYGSRNLYGIHHIRKDCNQIISRMNNGHSEIDELFSEKGRKNLTALKRWADAKQRQQSVSGVDDADGGNLPARRDPDPGG